MPANMLAGVRAIINCLSPVLATCLFLSAAYAPRPVAAEDSRERLKREAIGLFRQAVLPSEPTPTRCGLRKVWAVYSIPEDIGRRYLGLAIHADFASPYHGTRPDEVIDPDGRMPDAFCTVDEAKQERNRLAPGTMEAQPGGAACGNAPERSWFYQEDTEYSFPVFSADYRRAAIVVAHSEGRWIRTSAVDAKFCGVEGGVAARVYVRRGTGWRLIAHEILGQT
jgi:hypothetical protein